MVRSGIELQPLNNKLQGTVYRWYAASFILTHLRVFPGRLNNEVGFLAIGYCSRTIDDCFPYYLLEISVGEQGCDGGEQSRDGGSP